MNIQSTTSPNFQATKVLTAKKVLKNGTQEIYDVFKLNYKEDTNFIKKCNNLFKNNTTKNLSGFHKRLKNLFDNFLNKDNAMSEDFYLTIKDNESVVGCMNSVPVFNNVIPLNLTTKKYKDTKKILFYSFLNDSQKNYNNTSIDMNKLKTTNLTKKSEIKSNEIDSIKKEIKQNLPDFKIKTENKENINLEEILGTKDFETELYLN